MLRHGFAACAFATLAYPAGFTFSIGGPVASQDFKTKAAAFVFRVEGCAEPGKSEIAGTAEGLVKGERQSVELKLGQTSKPGVYAIYQTWPKDGDWVVNLKGTCGGDNAGAIVPIGPKGFIRESSKFLTHAASKKEIETSLKALAQGETK